MSLISKITEKLKNPTNGKILRKGVASVALASTLALSGCSGLASIFNPNNGQTNNPNIDNDNQTQIGGDGSATTPEEDLSGFSQITYNLLENSYYRNLMENYSSKQSGRESQIYDPVPYGFLQSEGYNIERIKNDELECDSIPYRKDGEENSLYIALRVETNAQTPYYTCYTLKYELSNLEMSDFHYLHINTLFEAPLFVQELSYQKTPVVESEASMTIDSYNEILKSLLRYDNVSSDLFGHKNLTIDIIKFSVPNNTLELQMRPASSDNVVAISSIRTAYLIPGFLGQEVSSVYDNVYSYPYSVTFENQDDMNYYLNNYESVTYYDTQNKFLTQYYLYDMIMEGKTKY